jgi:hypothetical protein
MAKAKETEQEKHILVQEQIKQLMVQYGESIFEEMKKDKTFLGTHDMFIVESVMGTLLEGIRQYKWDKYARNLQGKSLSLVRYTDLPDEVVKDGFKYVAEGVNFEYNEVFKTAEERQEAIEIAGLVIYNG